MQTIRHRYLFAAALLAASTAVAPQKGLAQEFSHGPTTATWIAGKSTWNGKHAFLDVYCVDFPEPHNVTSLSDGLLSNNAISYLRVVYGDDLLGAYVITSTVPQGRSDAEEFDKLLTNERNNAKTVNAASNGMERYAVSTAKSAWGPMIAVHLRNVAEESPDGIFPLARTLHADGEGRPHS